MVLNRAGLLYDSGGHLAMAEGICGCHKWKGSTGIRNIAEYPTMPRIDPLTNNYLNQSFNSCIIEELWPTKITISPKFLKFF